MAPQRDSIDDFDPDDLIPRVAHGSPTPQRPPQAPSRTMQGGWQHDQEQFDLEFEQQQHSTRQMSPEHADALVAYGEDHAGELDDPVVVDSPSQRGWNENTSNGASHDLEEDSLGGGVDIPFDPDEARAFDMGVPKETAQQYVSGFDDTDLPDVPLRSAGDQPYTAPSSSSLTDSHAGAYDEELGVSGSYDPYGTEAVQTPPYDPTASHVVGGMPDIDEVEVEPPAPQPPPTGARADTNVEDDLDTADFYAGQGMYGEAIDVLRAVLAHYPHHKLVNAKLREIEALAHGAMDSHPETVNAQVDYSQGTEALDLDEIEEVSVDDFEEVDDPGAPKKKRGPTVMLEKPVDESDADTHYDLGLAYKEMGLYEEAMKAFEKVLRVPAREVTCRIMLGMCQREMGNASEAIQQFKQGLHAEPQERERQSLYYEIGMTYESIGDDSEALYYFEMIMKRDPSFADAGARADALRARGAGRSQRRHDDDDI